MIYLINGVIEMLIIESYNLKHRLLTLIKSESHYGEVQVEHTITRNGTTYTEHYWTSPENVKHGDRIIGGFHNLPKDHLMYHDESPKSYKTFQTAGASMLYFGNNEKITLKPYGKWASKLTALHKVLLYKYTHGFDKGFNSYLRGLLHVKGMQDTVKKLNKAIHDMEKSIDEFELKDNIIVHRKVSSSMLKEFINAPHGLWQDDGFCSTSTVKGSYTGKLEGGVINLVIKVPAGKGRGAWLAPLSHFPNENEFLLNRGTKFRINKIRGDTVEMEVIGREPKDLEDLKKSLDNAGSEQLNELDNVLKELHDNLSGISYDKFTWQPGELKRIK